MPGGKWSEYLVVFAAGVITYGFLKAHFPSLPLP